MFHQLVGSYDSYSRSIERLMQFNVTFTHPTTTSDNPMDYGIFHFADTQQVFALLRKFQQKKTKIIAQQRLLNGQLSPLDGAIVQQTNQKKLVELEYIYMYTCENYDDVVDWCVSVCV